MSQHGSQARKTTLVIPVPEAQFVQPFRRQYLLRPSVAIPPHVSVCPEFLPGPLVTTEVTERLRVLAHNQRPFMIELGAVRSYPETGLLYWLAEPTGPLVALERLILQAFELTSAAHPHAAVHLTLGLAKPADSVTALEAKFRNRFADFLPVQAVAQELHLYTRLADAWSLTSMFPFSTVSDPSG